MDTLAKHPKVHVFSGRPFFMCQCTGLFVEKRYGLPGVLVLKSPTTENAGAIYGCFLDWNVCARWVKDQVAAGTITEEKGSDCVQYIIDTIGTKSGDTFAAAPPFDLLHTKAVSSEQYLKSYMRNTEHPRGSAADEYAAQQNSKDAKRQHETVRMESVMMKKAPSSYLRQFVVTTCPDAGVFHLEERDVVGGPGPEWISQATGISDWKLPHDQKREFVPVVYKPQVYNRNHQAFIKRMTTSSQKKPVVRKPKNVISTQPQVHQVQEGHVSA